MIPEWLENARLTPEEIIIAVCCYCPWEDRFSNEDCHACQRQLKGVAGAQLQAAYDAFLKQRLPLFQLGDFTLHSGGKSKLLIDCDALTGKDWEAVAYMMQERHNFGRVLGVPAGGLKLAKALEQYTTEGPTLIVDDVLTTGKSMEEMKATCEGEVIGAVVFARNECPNWIQPLFSMVHKHKLDRPELKGKKLTNNIGCMSKEQIEGFASMVLNECGYPHQMEWTTAGNILIGNTIYIDDRNINQYPYLAKYWVLHEIAHIDTHPQDDRHGEPFHSRLAELIEQFMGRSSY